MRANRAVSTVVLVSALILAACSSDDGSKTSPSTTATTAAPPTTALEVSLTLEAEIPVDPSYRQGVARTEDGWVFSNADLLDRVDDDLKIVVHKTDAIPDVWAAKGFNHIGDIDIVGDYIYAPYEQPDYAKGEQAMARYDATTLEFVDAVAIAQNENSFVTIDPESMTGYSMMNFGGKALLRYHVTESNEWEPLAPLKMSRTVNRVQGADIAGGAVWLASDDAKKGIYRVDLETGEVTQVGSMGHVEPAGASEGEGIDADSSELRTIMIATIAGPVLFQTFAVS